MAEEKRKALVKGNTPTGILVFPWITKPDTKFDAGGTYTTKLRLTNEEAAPMVKSLTEAHTAAVKQMKDENPKKAKKMKAADLPFKDETDDKGEETGHILFNFKMKATVTSKKDKKTYTQAPDLFDAAGKKITVCPPIYGGSKAKIAYEIVPFFTDLAGAGISLRMKAVKVIELVSSSRDADSYGFGEEEDGYQAPAAGATEGVDPDDVNAAADDAAGGDDTPDF